MADYTQYHCEDSNMSFNSPEKLGAQPLDNHGVSPTPGEFSLSSYTLADMRVGVNPTGHADRSLPIVLASESGSSGEQTQAQRVLEWARQWERDNPEAAARIQRGEDPTLRIPLDILNPSKS